MHPPLPGCTMSGNAGALPFPLGWGIPGISAPSYQRERCVEERDHDIGYSQVHNEQAGGRVHTLRLDDNMTDQDIAEEGEDDDEGVRRDEQGFHRGALRLRSVPAPVHKAPPVGQAVIIPGKETRHVRDYESLLQAPIEG